MRPVKIPHGRKNFASNGRSIKGCENKGYNRIPPWPRSIETMVAQFVR